MRALVKPKRTVIKVLLFAGLIAATAFAWAGPVAGTVTHLSGPLLAKKADGTVKVLARKSEVEQGDTLIAEKGTYAQIRFIDNSEVTLKPDTTFKIDAFAYEAGKPEADSASFSLVKGGLRSITGLLGKRNKEKFSLKTPTATIGIRGTTFIVQYVKEGGPAGTASLPPGMHVQVVDGAIIVTNSGGSLGFAAGQFGYVPSMVQPPVIVPVNPGLHFAPPPAFANAGVQVSTAGGMAVAGADGAVDCIVR